MDEDLAGLKRQWDLNDLRGRQFLRLLRLSHAEGLLPELLQASLNEAVSPL